MVEDLGMLEKGRAAAHLADKSFYRYHHLTKHTFQKLLSSSYRLDWALQPDPFREYLGAEKIELPREIPVSDLTYFQAVESMMTGQGLAETGALPAAQPCDLSFLSSLLYYSMAISAWKQIPNTEHRWSLRVNPSSGNLHPTETHLLVRACEGLDAGAYHYYVPRHELEIRARGNHASVIWEDLAGSTDAPPLVVVLTSIFWREAWKYRDRAYRYCQHDMGHALCAVLLSAAVLGWRAETIGEFPDASVAELLGLSDGDENPCLVVGLRPGLLRTDLAKLSGAGRRRWQSCPGVFQGEPNALSRSVVDYSSIERVHRSTCLDEDDWRKRARPELPASGTRPAEMVACAAIIACSSEAFSPVSEESVHSVIRRRRSAVDLDGRQRMDVTELGAILDYGTRGFNADFQRPSPWSPSSSLDASGHHLIHIYVYAHRIDGVEPGIYYFDRLRQELVPLVHADEREAAKFGSCFQDIAADGCFAVSMVADFNLAFRLYGDRGYRYVHYEAGFIGQLIYLSATALGYDSTGIGCFTDDVVNELLGLAPGREVIYHFTVGRAILDPRLTTLPSYDFPDPTQPECE